MSVVIDAPRASALDRPGLDQDLNPVPQADGLDPVIAAARAIADKGVPVVVHSVTDGRDVPPSSALAFVKELRAALPEGARIGTVIGRYYAMDRDNRWERVARAYAAMVRAEGLSAADPVEAVTASYAREETDEFIQPTVIGDYAGARDGDGFFCLNFRADRAREILAAIGQPGFDAFDMADHYGSAEIVAGMVSKGPSMTVTDSPTS